MLVEARQSFSIFQTKKWFLGNNRGLPRFSYRILHNLISTTKFEKTYFKLTTLMEGISFIGSYSFYWKPSILVKIFLFS